MGNIRYFVRAAMVAAAALAFLTTGIAQATKVLVTVTGTVVVSKSSSMPSINIGIFGPGFSVLDGLGFRIDYVFDVHNAGAHVFQPDGAYSLETIFGGAFVGTAPMSSAVITINGVAYGLTGISYGEISADEQRRRFAVEDWDNSDGVQAQVITTFYDPSQGLPARVKASGTYSLPANEGDPSYPYEPNFTILDHGNLALGSMKPTLFSVSLLVPEPASWAMLLLGFGSIGAAMRRRGKVALRPA